MKKRIALVLTVLFLLVLAPVALGYYDGGGSDGGRLLPATVLCYYDGGGSDGG